MSRAGDDGSESWALIAKVGESLWSGTAAASPVDAQQAMTKVEGIERTCIIIRRKTVLARARKLEEKTNVEDWEDSR